jgi:hypothetical protein
LAIAGHPLPLRPFSATLISRLELAQRDFAVPCFAGFDVWVAFIPDASLFAALVEIGFSVT